MDRRLACLILLGACGDDAAVTPDAAASLAAIAHFDPPTAGDGADWGQIPWPSDLFLGADGKLKLLSLPAGANADAASTDMLIEGLASMNGAGLRSSAYFPIELASGADLDPATLDGAAVILDLTTGDPIDANVLWRDDLGEIAVLPTLGSVLLPGRQYAAYLTDAIQTTDGDPLAADARFDRADATVAPLFDTLSEAAASHVVVATVFTTSTFALQTQKMRDVVAASPPTITIDAVYGPGGTALSTIAGTQTADAVPGNCLIAGRGQPTNHIAAMVHGTMQIPSFLSATLNVDGFPEYDNGNPVVQGLIPVPFSMTLPITADASWADMPVTIYVHGIGRSRHDFLTQANTAARAGSAMIAIDLPYHGSRANGAVDQKNETLGTGDATTPTPDGFGDLRGLFSATGLFHLGTSGGIPGFHPRAMGENLRQAAIELTAVVAFVRDGDDAPLETAINAALTGLPTTVTFRDDLGLVTESLGAMISGVTLAIEPSIGVAYLSSPAAGFPSPAMLHSPNYAGIFSASITETFDIASRIDVADPAHDYPTDPLVMLFDNVVERGDALAYAPLVTSGALRGDVPPDVVSAMAWGDVWVSNDTEEGYAAALDLPVSTMALPTPATDPIRFAELSALAWPVSANRPGGKSGCFVVFNPAGHASIRLVQEELDYEPVFPPYTEISPPRLIPDSQVAQIQELWGELLADHFDGGGAVSITDPYADASWFVPGSTCP